MRYMAANQIPGIRGIGDDYRPLARGRPEDAVGPLRPDRQVCVVKQLADGLPSFLDFGVVRGVNPCGAIL